MTEAEWNVSSDPQMMLAWLLDVARPRAEEGGGGVPGTSSRKLRLWCAALTWQKWGRFPTEDARYRLRWDEGEPDADEPRGQPMRLAQTWARRIDDEDNEPSQKVKAALLQELFGNPFSPVTLPKVIVPADEPGHCVIRCPWITTQVLSLANAAYEERGRKCPECRRTPGKTWESGIDGGWFKCEACHGTGRTDDGTLDPARLAVLSDALEEAGCTDAAILRHLRDEAWCSHCADWKRIVAQRCIACKKTHDGPRDPGPHYRGCYVLDAILGRE